MNDEINHFLSMIIVLIVFILLIGLLLLVVGAVAKFYGWF